MPESSRFERGPDMMKLLEERKKFYKGREAGKSEVYFTKTPGPWGEATNSFSWHTFLYSPSQVRNQVFSQILDPAVEFSEIRTKINDLASGLESVKKELNSCRKAIIKVHKELSEKPVVKQAELFDIDETLYVIQPIPIVIEDWGNEVIASFPEIEAFGLGKSEPEAIGELKDSIRELYYDLTETPKDKLGKLPLSWIRILERLIKKVGET